MHPGVHWLALVMGKPGGPTCRDCHGSHNVLPPKNPRSSVYRDTVPKTCGRCHPDEYSDYRESVHGVALAKGNADVPVCADCHGEHPVQGPNEPGSPVSPLQVPETCSRCHEPLGLRGRYGLPPARYETYRSSYHGIANWFGSVAVAECASCHGAHRILPSSDPRSSINRANLPETCGKCHPDAGEHFTQGSVHVLPSPRRDVGVFWVRTFYRVFVAGLIIVFCLYIALDMAARVRRAHETGTSAHD